MPRADLHYALVLDDEIFMASQVDPTLLDPVVRIDGPLPGASRPVAVVRDYQGPQGSYLEQFVIRDRSGRVAYTSPVRRIELTGEMFEDRTVDHVGGLELARGDEHSATFSVGGHEVATIPVFIEAGLGGDPQTAAAETFNKALAKGAVVWVTVPGTPGRRGRPAHTQGVWYVTRDDNVYVLTGPTEQHVPGLAEAAEVELIARSKDLRSRVSRVTAAVRVVPGDDPLWDKVAQDGLGRRLNLPDGEGALERWRSQCVLVELSPRFRDVAVETDGEAATSAPAAPAPGGAPAAASTADAPADAPAEAPAAAPKADDVHVEAQVDQEVYDQLIAEGKSDRVARAKAKAAYVRKEKARILAERGAG